MPKCPGRSLQGPAVRILNRIPTIVLHRPALLYRLNLSNISLSLDHSFSVSMYLGIAGSYDCFFETSLYELAITFQRLVSNCQQTLEQIKETWLTVANRLIG